jgi:hypothetical protein
MARTTPKAKSHDIHKYPVVEFKVYPGEKDKEVKDIRILVNESDFPDDFTSTEKFIESVANTAKNDADELLTREDRKKKNDEFHPHHTEKIYFKPFRAKTEKRLKKALESFGIDDYYHYKDIIDQRNAIKAEKAELDQLKETRKTELEEHKKQLGLVSVPAENETAIFNPTDYAMLSEFPKPPDYKSLNFSTESKRNLDYVMKRFKNGIGISPQVNRVQFKNEYFRRFIDREFLWENKYISYRDEIREHRERVATLPKSSRFVNETKPPRHKADQTIADLQKNPDNDNKVQKFEKRATGRTLGTIEETDEETDEEKDGGGNRFSGGSYRPLKYREFTDEKISQILNGIKQISDYETETKKDDTRISAPLEKGVMVYVQLKGADTMEATISKYIGYAAKDATGSTKCVAPINTAKLYGKENKCDNFYIVTYYSNELSEKNYSDSNNKPIAVPQSRIKIINDSLVARLNDEINVPFTNVNYFNFLHMVKYALTKISILGSKWYIGSILSELGSKMNNDEAFKNSLKFQHPDIRKQVSDFLSQFKSPFPGNFIESSKNALLGKRNPNEQAKINKAIYANKYAFPTGGTRKRKHYFKKTRKNKGGDANDYRGDKQQKILLENPLYILLSQFIDTSNIYENPKLEEAFSKDADDEIFKHQRVPLYIIVEQFRFLLMAYAVCKGISTTELMLMIDDNSKLNKLNKSYKDTLITLSHYLDPRKNKSIRYVELIQYCIGIMHRFSQHSKRGVTFLETTMDIDGKKRNFLIFINGKIHELIETISSHESFNSKKEEIGKLFEEAAKQMFTHYTDKIFEKPTDDLPVFIETIVTIIRKSYPMRVLKFNRQKDINAANKMVTVAANATGKAVTAAANKTRKALNNAAQFTRLPNQLRSKLNRKE